METPITLECSENGPVTHSARPAHAGILLTTGREAPNSSTVNIRDPSTSGCKRIEQPKLLLRSSTLACILNFFRNPPKTILENVKMSPFPVVIGALLGESDLRSIGGVRRAHTGSYPCISRNLVVFPYFVRCVPVLCPHKNVVNIKQLPEPVCLAEVLMSRCRDEDDPELVTEVAIRSRSRANLCVRHFPCRQKNEHSTQNVVDSSQKYYYGVNIVERNSNDIGHRGRVV